MGLWVSSCRQIVSSLQKNHLFPKEALSRLQSPVEPASAQSPRYNVETDHRGPSMPACPRSSASSAERELSQAAPGSWIAEGVMSPKVAAACEVPAAAAEFCLLDTFSQQLVQMR